MAAGEDEEKNYPSLRYVMQKNLGGVAVASVLTVFIIVLVAVIVTGDQTQEIARRSLVEQVDRQVRKSSIELSLSVEEQLRAVDSSAVRYMGSVVAQSLSGEGVTMAPDDPDNDPWHASVPSPTTLPRIQSKTGDPDGSVWYLAGQSSEPGSLSATVSELRVNTTVVDVFATPVYDSLPAVLSMYTGFEEEGFFRLFPGYEVETAPSYDPRARGWYTAAMALAAGQTATTGPYLDAFGNGWLMSLSSQVVLPDFTSGSAAGVAGDAIGVSSVDIPVGYIRDSVISVSFFTRPAAHMATLDGALIASPFWDSDDFAGLDPLTDPSPPNIWDLSATGISQSFFEASLASTSSATGAAVFEATGTDGIVRLYARSFVPPHPCDRPAPSSTCSSDAWDPFSVIVVAARKEDALEGLSAMEGRIADSQTLMITLVVVISLVTLLAVICILLALVRSITNPLLHVVEAAKDITKRSGGDDIHTEVDLDETLKGLPDDEIGSFVRNFVVMVRGISKTSATAVSDPPSVQKNPFRADAPWSYALSRLGIRRRGGAYDPSAAAPPSSGHGAGAASATHPSRSSAEGGAVPPPPKYPAGGAAL